MTPTENKTEAKKELKEDVLGGNRTGNTIILLSCLAFLASLLTGTLVTIGRSGINEVSFTDSPKLFTLLFIIYGAGFVAILRRLWRNYFRTNSNIKQDD